MKKHTKQALSLVLAGVMLIGTLSGCQTDPGTPSGSAAPNPTGSTPAIGSWSEEKTADGWMKVTNEGGITLGYSPDSGVKLIEVDGYAFKDLNKNGTLDVYEDWRLDAETRATDLAGQLTADQIAGLMIHPSMSTITEEASEMTEILDSGVRSILSHASAFPADVQAKWNNTMQTNVEGVGLGIPVSISTNPRTTPTWPDNLGLAATFDPDMVFKAAQGMSKEYRALGISTLLGPQIDLAAEPRWVRIGGTFGEDPALSRDMTAASVAGHQSTYDESGKDLGWGADSVNAMIKHWPGDGTGESGRESHDWFGQFAVYPGGQYETSLIPFVDGGLNSGSATGGAAAVMTSYSVAWSDDESYGELVGSAFSSEKIDLLHSYGFDGVICSDWRVTEDPAVNPLATGWGVDGLTQAERCYKAIMAGTDQIGGQLAVQPVFDAYAMGVEEHGEEIMLQRFQDSARRLMKTYFQTGLFENAYVSVAHAKEIVGGAEMLAAGYEAQLKSIVMLKNNGAIAMSESTEKPTVYIPYMYSEATSFYAGAYVAPASATLPVDIELARKYVNVVTDKLSETLTGPADKDGKPTVAYADIIRATKDELAECDFALAVIKAPANATTGVISNGYDTATESFIPISLQYGPYTADSDSVRTESISGRMVEQEVVNAYGVQKIKAKENNSYYGKSAKISNASHLDSILYATENMPEGAKVIVAIDTANPIVVSEFESQVDAILMGFAMNKETIMEIVTGKYEPSGLLPFQMPANMETVEAQYEDVPRDMECYVDAEGNTYDFAFGMNWSGVIDDARTAKYNVAPLVSPETQPAE